MTTLRELELTLIVSVPMRTLVNVVTAMSLRCTVVVEVRRIVRRRVAPQ